MTTQNLRRVFWRPSVRVIAAAVAVLIFGGRGTVRPTVQAQSCTNPVCTENQRTGDPTWDVSGSGDPTIQGFATAISINSGETESFKVNTDSASYKIDIYRLGYYGGAGARLVATVAPSATLPQTQPDCVVDPASGLADCGNWATSASWTSTGAVSGVYVAKLTRNDTGGASHMIFVVRDDARRADVIVQTSDTTWQAYNQYGGGSLYCGGPLSNANTAYSCSTRSSKVSYNRPIDTRAHDPQSFLFNAEYPMMRFLEANGYDVKYWSGVDTDRRGADLLGALKPKAFFSVGHDEYWSGAQRTSVENARNAGVSLAFFSGNEMFWKTRYEPSIDGSNTAYRTLVSYKETLASAKIDPALDASGHPIWTGSWRDPRFSPPADGGRPENGLIGQIWTVNSGTSSIRVPAEMAGLRFWRNTRVAGALITGATTTLSQDSLGYEWDEDLDNGARPTGLVHLSSTTVDGVDKIIDFGAKTGPGSATHSMTIYRHSSGALVFGGGTVQWSWGLDGNHDRGDVAAAHVADPAMQQATVNLLADMGAQPGTLQIGADPTKPLIASPASLDTIAPSAVITSPIAGSVVGSGDRVTITGTASDTGGVVAGVEVSVDGTTWHSAVGLANWSYDWPVGAVGQATIRARAIDDSGNVQASAASVIVTVNAGSCPCTSLFKPTTVPIVPDTDDPSPLEIGLKFRSDVSGSITGVRFYKSANNTGTHIGNLWTSGGTLMASAIFSGETASGWQEVLFDSPVSIVANTTYVVSYHSNVGHYASTGGYFGTFGVDASPLHAPVSSTVGGNGLFLYGPTAFPTQTFNATNYWVDVVFSSVVDTTPPAIGDVAATAVDSSVANVTWTTNEDATSAVDYSTDSTFQTQTQTVSDPAFVRAHSLRISGLLASTHYYIRVRSTDRAGNTAVSPSTAGGPPPVPGGPPPPTPPGFTTSSPTLHDTVSADFKAGTTTGTYVSETGDGEVILAPSSATEFAGSTMPAGWSTRVWSDGGTAVVNGGRLTVDGARVAACTIDANGICQDQLNIGPGHVLEFVGTFTGDPFQHSGFAQTLEVGGEPFALFSTDGGSTLSVRTSDGLNALKTDLGTTFLNAPHRFRIDWQPMQFVYSVDGAQVATHAIPVASLMRAMAASDFNAFSGNIVVDWVRSSPYASSGSFLSRVFDATTSVNWQSISWVAKPSASTVSISVRTGATPTPDSTWSPFTAVAAPGAIALQSRYIQYQAQMATADPSQTPELDDIMIVGSAPLPPPPPPPATAPAIAWATPAAITYGTPLSATQLNATASAPGQFVYTPPLGTVLGAGSSVLTVAFVPADPSKYLPASSSVSITVLKATPVITWANPAAITFGTPLGAAQLNATANVPGTFAYTPASGTKLAVGAGQTLSAAFTPTSAANYNAAAKSVLITVTQATPTIALASSNATSLFGVPITFTATVAPLGATGTVSFTDGTTPIACKPAGSSLTAPVATCQTSSLAIGTHTISAVYGGDLNDAGGARASVAQVISASSVLSIQFTTHVLLDNTNKPKVKEVPVAAARVRVYRKNDACTNGLIVSGRERIWGMVFDGLDGYNAAGDTDAGCTPVTVGSYRAEGTTDANGNVNIIVPPALTHPDTDYVVIGRTLDFDDTTTAAAIDPLYSEKTLDVIKAGAQKAMQLHQLRLFSGKRVPGKDLEEYGTYLAIVEPEYMDWTTPEEQYPFILIADGDWGITTSIVPPEGFIADVPELTTEVTDAVTALQFTLTDVGSDWSSTGITHVITHKGETRIRTSKVPMFNKQKKNTDANDSANGAHHTPAALPVLSKRLVTGLMGTLP
jgi:N,N-dimethylformamidase beta subunit-like protein/uncharacterized protein DUF4082/Big-like domain-containing protein